MIKRMFKKLREDLRFAERVEFLMYLYDIMREEDDLHYKVLVNDKISNFDLQYLEAAELIKVFKEDGLKFATLTMKGINLVEKIALEMFDFAIETDVEDESFYDEHSNKKYNREYCEVFNNCDDCDDCNDSDDYDYCEDEDDEDIFEEENENEEDSGEKLNNVKVIFIDRSRLH